MTSFQPIAKSGQTLRSLSFHLTFARDLHRDARRLRAQRLANCDRIAQSAAGRRKGGRPMSLEGEAIAVAVSIPAELENNGISPELSLTQFVGRLPPGRQLRWPVDGNYAFLTSDVQYFRGNRRACGRNYGGGRR